MKRKEREAGREGERKGEGSGGEGPPTAFWTNRTHSYIQLSKTAITLVNVSAVYWQIGGQSLGARKLGARAYNGSLGAGPSARSRGF